MWVSKLRRSRKPPLSNKEIIHLLRYPPSPLWLLVVKIQLIEPGRRALAGIPTGCVPKWEAEAGGPLFVPHPGRIPLPKGHFSGAE